jgi:GTP-binding protein
VKVLSAEFIKSAAAPSGYPRGQRPEVAFCGRSNVGKSSLINSLLNRRRLAQTSKTPGKTRTLNFFLINERFHFVDLPGYGYAKVSRNIHESWGGMIEQYLSKRLLLRGAILLIDIRHPPTKFDRRMKEWLDHYGHRVALVATKADKVGSAARRRQMDIIRRDLPVLDGQSLIAFSSSSGLGKDRLWAVIDQFLSRGSGTGRKD